MGSCVAGTHNCNGICQSNTSPNSCGASSCTPCATPANGVATCDGTQCGFNCSVGFHLCGNACVANSGVANCGTTSCTACVAPANGSAICDGLQCGFQCGTGFHACGSSCAANSSAQSCGTSCTACPVPASGSATCNGTSCGIACNTGFHNCGGLCVSNSSVANCGSSCVACPVPTNGTATCDGTSCGALITSFNLLVSTTGIAGATGTATPSPAGTSCGTGCFSYGAGTSVKITAAATSGSLFGGWEGDCVGQGATCTLTLSADSTAFAHFRPSKNIVFITDGTLVVGAIGSSLASADAFCASSAKSAFIGGTVWRAWLATTNINAATHVGSSTTGWIRVDGRPFATSMANLLAGQIYYPPRLTELGNDTSNSVATGAQADGSAFAGGTCADWTSLTGAVFAGYSRATTQGWTALTQIGPGDTCGNFPTSIYCFEADTGMAAVSPPVAPANGRHAFVSTTLWTPGGGVAAADAVCQADATAAALAIPTNYRALLTTAVPATDSTRIDLTGQPWYRLDGAQLVVTAADLADPDASKMLTALNFTSSRQYRAEQATWTGTLVSPSSTDMTLNCANWTTNSTSAMGEVGGANISAPFWWHDGSAGLLRCCDALLFREVAVLIEATGVCSLTRELRGLGCVVFMRGSLTHEIVPRQTERTMTRRGASLRPGLWIWPTPALLTIRSASLRAWGWIWLGSILGMGCGQVRTVMTMPAGSPDAAVADTGGSDTGSGSPDLGSGMPDVSSGTPDVSPGMPDVGPGKPDVAPGMPDVGPGMPDAKVDAPAAADAMGGDANVECSPTSHICGGICVSRIDVNHCGDSCFSCPAPTGGGATCDGLFCGAFCPAGTKLCAGACIPMANSCIGDCFTAGTHLCNDICVSNNDVRTCGFSCTVCVVPTGGTATCDGVSCGASCPAGQKLCTGACIPVANSCQGICPAGMHDCNGTCQADGDPANCGLACAACPAPAHGVAVCNSGICAAVCAAGFHVCAGNCLPNDSVQSCGFSCLPCPVLPGGIATCDGQVCGMEMPHPG